ncbi:NAK/MPSK protein kinase, partial [Phytophthora megakarya]
MGNAFARVNGKLFEVVRELHEGGFAHVYEVKRGDKHFALKWTRSVTEGEELERVLLELQVQRQLQHVHVLRLEAAEVRKTHDGEKEALMLFPLATRGSLQSLLEHAAVTGIAAFNETECLHFFTKLLDAVAAVHESGFAHRDIKPANILLSEDDPMEPLLMDFGSVAPLQVQLSGVTEYRKLWEDAARFSSSPYRAPELWEGGDMELVDGRTDVWSLGCVLYALAFGPFSPFEHPRDGVQHIAIMNGYVAFPHDNKHCGQVFSATFTALIKWILTPDVAERPKLHGVRLCMNQL